MAGTGPAMTARESPFASGPAAKKLQKITLEGLISHNVELKRSAALT